MELGITKEKAKDLLDEYVKDPIIKLHMIESEAIMRALAEKFYKEEEPAVTEAMADEWGIIGLLHDIDWEMVKDNPAEHCVRAQEILRNNGASEFLIETIVSHVYGMEIIPAFKDKVRNSKIQHCLVAAETLTGLIVASALMQPDKKLASVSLESLKKKFKSKNFAARCNRDLILECEKADVPLDEFLALGLKALQNISGKLGL
ncbi:MAG: Metal dependent phosphohydrolase [Candidatus Moranbacteria bacterium GW2011_GWE1_35_17]|nr:MAG: Metal dependent phosphohydrolase [Candidatus Moranbacteria bacterium GW2011_GWE1_35_17]KKP70457.1 MAG: Metal dependent phosphohydrolase [Candidatus Moranbacteria bacterium GW2011_GWE2_35_164]KKP84619.1 MAG: Metal dependent phosphohydrolase [Candidatus Moranbacteria bacterium GW2011_GWF2_35_54]